MKMTLRAVFAVMFIAALAMLTASVSASADAVRTPIVTWSSLPKALQNDPVAKERLLALLRLYEQAKTDGDARKKLESLDQRKNKFPFTGFQKLSLSGGALLLQEKKAREWAASLGPVPSLSERGEAAYQLAQERESLRDQATDQAAAASGQVPYRNPAPALSRNVLVTRDFGYPVQTEPSVCSNPENRKNVVVAAIDYGILPSHSAYASIDGGVTWRGPYQVPLTERGVMASDPVLACGRGDKTYQALMSIAFDDYYQIGGQEFTVARSDIAVTTATNNGTKWGNPSVVASNDIQLGKLELRDPASGQTRTLDILVDSFLDKPWITVGPDPANPKKDVVYVSYTKFTSYTIILTFGPWIAPIPLQMTSEIAVHASRDNGRTWKPVGATPSVPALSQTILDTGEFFSAFEIRWVQGSSLAVARDGTLYVSWYDSMRDGGGKGSNQIFVTKTQNLGATWMKPAVAAEVLETYSTPRSTPFRNSTFPSIAASGKGVYLVFPGRTPGKPIDDGDVYFVRGQNAGKTITFSKPKRINEDQGNALQFFPTITADDKGKLHVLWGDTRDHSLGLRYNMYYTASENGGKTWGFEHNGIREADTKVSDFYSNPNKGFRNGLFIGDYLGIAPDGEGGAYFVWPDTRLGEYGGMNQKIAFARKEAMPSPSIFLNPTQGSIGEQVTVEASNFQPDAYIYVRVGSEIQGKGKTNDEGFLKFRVDMPLADSESSREVQVFDESGNAAVASFFFETGIDDLARTDDVKQFVDQTTAETNVLKAEVASIKTKNTLMFYLLFGAASLVVGFAAVKLFTFLRKRRASR